MDEALGMAMILATVLGAIGIMVKFFSKRRMVFCACGAAVLVAKAAEGDNFQEKGKCGRCGEEMILNSRE